MPSSPVRVTPWKRSFSHNETRDSEGRTKAPPSEVVTFLLAWKLKDTRSPKLPILRLRQLAPSDCAASSITLSLCLPASM